MAKREDRRLGKGLGALLGEYLDEGAEGGAGAERQVPVDSVAPNPFQPRSDFETEALDALKESIRQNGLLQPLLVRPAGDDEWELVAGERRWRALKELGWTRAPAVVRDLSDDEMLVLALVENLQREDLSPVEEARGFQRLVEGFGLTHTEVARRVGRDRSTVSNSLRLLGLPEEIVALLDAGRLSAGHGRALLGLDTAEEQVLLARRVVERGLSVRETEERVRSARQEETADDRREDGAASSGSGDGAGRKDPVARKAERILERVFGTRVRVSVAGGDRGEIALSFHDTEEFERIFRLLAGEEAEDLLDGP